MVTNLVGAHSRAPIAAKATRRDLQAWARGCAPLRLRLANRRRDLVYPASEFVLLPAVRVFSIEVPATWIRLNVFVNLTDGALVSDDVFPIATLPNGRAVEVAHRIDLPRA